MVIGRPTYYKRKDSRWVSEIKVKCGADIKHKYFYGKQKNEVVLKMNEFLQSPEIVKATESILVSTYALKWLETKRSGLKPASFDRVEGVVQNHINRLLSDYEIGKLDAFDISKAISTYQAENCSYSSMKKFYEYLNAILKHAVETETIRKNPIIESAHRPNKKKFEAERETKKERIFTEEELERFKATCFSKYSNGKYKYSSRWEFQFMMNTGVRVGEMLCLTYGDIDLDKKLLYIKKNVVRVNNRDKNGKRLKGTVSKLQKTTKGGNDRVIPLNAKAVEAVLEMKKTNYKDDNSLLVQNKNGGYVKASNYDQKFYTVLKNANIERTGLHTLRHQFASTLLEDGSISLKRISVLLGHADVSTTVNTYIHIIKRLEEQDELNICV